MTRPYIQIDGEVREMTEEEEAVYLETVPAESQTQLLPGEQAASEPVEEEGSPDAPVADSSSGPSAD